MAIKKSKLNQRTFVAGLIVFVFLIIAIFIVFTVNNDKSTIEDRLPGNVAREVFRDAVNDPTKVINSCKQSAQYDECISDVASLYTLYVNVSGSVSFCKTIDDSTLRSQCLISIVNAWRNKVVFSSPENAEDLRTVDAYKHVSESCQLIKESLDVWGLRCLEMFIAALEKLELTQSEKDAVCETIPKADLEELAIQYQVTQSIC